MERRYYDASMVTVTSGNPEKSFVLAGTINDKPDYYFSVKVYDVGSEYGIDEGRISKLNLYSQSDLVASFDRGFWDVEPTTSEHREAVSKIVTAFSQPVKMSRADIAEFQRQETRDATRQYREEKAAQVAPERQRDTWFKEAPQERASANPMEFFQKPADLRAEHKPPEGKSLADKKARQSEGQTRSHKR